MGHCQPSAPVNRILPGRGHKQPVPASLPPSHRRAACPAAAAHPRAHSGGRGHQAGARPLGFGLAFCRRWERCPGAYGSRGVGLRPGAEGAEAFRRFRTGWEHPGATAGDPAGPGRAARLSRGGKRRAGRAPDLSRPVAVTSHAAAP